MKEIKFRAWDEPHNEMVYSDTEDCFYINTKGVLFMYAIPKSESGVGNTKYHKDYNVMQYAGLKDKNGVEIYEGDIIKGYQHNPNETFVVKFLADKYSCGFIASNNDDCNPYVHIWYEGFEVVGNIHENKELLDGE